MVTLVSGSRRLVTSEFLRSIHTSRLLDIDLLARAKPMWHLVLSAMTEINKIQIQHMLISGKYKAKQ